MTNNMQSNSLVGKLHPVHCCSITSLSYGPTVEMPNLEANTVVAMQANPSYTPMEDGVTLEPNPCYSAMQANSDYEAVSGEGKG